MKILLIGSSGQLGSQIIKSAPKNINLLTPSRIELNLSKEEECYEYVINSSPDWIINCGAYTNVDQAEEDQEAAYKINALGPKALAKALSITGGKLLHVSTDYVFGGDQNSPYKTSQIISPINFYGTSKGKVLIIPMFYCYTNPSFRFYYINFDQYPIVYIQAS